MKNALLFTYSKNILVRLLTVNMKNCLTQESKNVRPLQVTLLKMRPPYSQSRGTSPLASYNKVPPPPPPITPWEKPQFHLATYSSPLYTPYPSC